MYIPSVLSKKLQAAFSFDFVLQKGLLSTPFHRVYFQNETIPRVEQLPGERFKLPLGVRLHQYVGNRLVIKYFYRFYGDTWGIIGNTASIEMPLKATHTFSVYPFYRIHHQAAAKYFAPYKEHLDGETYFTSDYDLSSFTTQEVGGGLRWSPIKALLSKRKEEKLKAVINGLALRGSWYKRNDGLKAFMISSRVSFQF